MNLNLCFLLHLSQSILFQMLRVESHPGEVVINVITNCARMGNVLGHHGW